MSAQKCLHAGWDFVRVNHNTDAIPGEEERELACVSRQVKANTALAVETGCALQKRRDLRAAFSLLSSASAADIRRS